MAYNPCDHCKMFDQLQHPYLFCRGCVESGRYEKQKREGEHNEANG